MVIRERKKGRDGGKGEREGSEGGIDARPLSQRREGTMWGGGNWEGAAVLLFVLRTVFGSQGNTLFLAPRIGLPSPTQAAAPQYAKRV